MKALIVSGAWESETTVLNATAAPTSRRTAADAIALRASTPERSDTRIERRTKKLTTSA